MVDLNLESLLYSLLLALLMAGCCTAVAQELPILDSSAEVSQHFDRAAFLALINGQRAVSIDELKQFYRRPEYIPLRVKSWTRNAAAIRDLGKQIFFDTRLSKSGTLSCSSCHNPTLHWTDGLARSPENEFRRSMSLYDLAWDKQFLWNARAGSLMSQSALALNAQGGMDLDLAEVASKLNGISSYATRFREAFEIAELDEAPATLARTAAALEVFVSTIISPPTRFDRWIEGDENAISKRARNGFVLFNGKAQCAQCHNSWRFSDGQVYNTGLLSQCEDARKEQTSASWNHGKFKAVGLRFIAARPPYMHDGSLKTLAQVIEFYDRGGDVHCGITSAHSRPLGLSADEVEDLVLFLDTLGSGSQEYVLPELPQ